MINTNKIKYIFAGLSLLAASVASASELLANDLNVSHEVMAAPTMNGLQTIDDEGLNDVQGQALLEFSQRVNSDGMQFQKLLLNAKIETNLNISELKLGDDIHLEKVSLSGGEGPDSYATIVRPFLELAMKNYGDTSNRELVGLRLAFEDAQGVMGVGQQDLSPDCLANGASACTNETGIRSFHGYLTTNEASADAVVGAVRVEEYFNARANNIMFDYNGDGDFDDEFDVVPKQYFYPNQILTGEAGNARPTYQEHYDNNTFWVPTCDALFCSGNIGHKEGGNIDATIDGIGKVLFGSQDAEFGIVPKVDVPSIVRTFTIPGLVVNTDSGPIDSIEIQADIVPYPNLIYVERESDATGFDENDPNDPNDDTISVWSSSNVKYVDSNLLGGIDLDGIDILMDALVTNIRISPTLDQSLKFLHKLNLSGAGGGTGGNTSLSIQSEDVHWDGATVAAKPGYWLAFEAPAQLGDENGYLGVLPQTVHFKDADYRTFEVALERALFTADRPQLAFSIGEAIGVGVPVGEVPFQSLLTTTLTDLPLGKVQAPPVNCYGGVDCF